MIRLLTIYCLMSTLFTFGQAGDCPALCVTSDIVATTAVDGSVAELNNTNAGCLNTVYEATSSYWYQVCFSSNGTFAFTMNPSGNKNDFDFAIWNGTSCPPTAAPIRCSYAAVPIAFGNDLTGLGNGATDVSEGTGGDQWVAPINVTSGQCITMCINNFGNGSDVFDLDFTGTATMTCVGTLPIELTEFICRDGIIVWSVASQNNNDYFQIEWSADTYQFEVINTTDGAGTYNEVAHYACKSPKEGGYYRLKQVDFDGSYKYSNIIYCGSDTSEIKTIEVYDMLGKLVYLGEEDKFNLSSKPKGLYLIRDKNKISKVTNY